MCGLLFRMNFRISRHESFIFRRQDACLAEKGLLWVFTTRADTIMGVTFVAVAAEHPLAGQAARDNPELAAFVEECKRGSVMEADLATMEKKGMATGLSVIHPLTNEKIPVWVGNYVLMAYGEGAVMGVPGHDRARLRFREAIRPADQAGDPTSAGSAGSITTAADMAGVVREYGRRASTRASTTASTTQQAVDAIAADLKAMGLGEKQVLWRLRDWGISRQRYWGTPIPIIHCPACGDVPVPDDQLPVVLPEDCVPDGTGNPLNKRADFVNCQCPKCGKPARRETDTMDTFVDSSWYYMRYACPDNAEHDGGRARALLAAGRPVHRRHRARHSAPALLALLDQGHARPRARRLRTNRLRAICSRRAWC